MKRRDFLVQSGLASLAPAAAQAGERGRPGLKITDTKTWLVGVLQPLDQVPPALESGGLHRGPP
jgi:hypothetical protein